MILFPVSSFSGTVRCVWSAQKSCNLFEEPGGRRRTGSAHHAGFLHRYTTEQQESALYWYAVLKQFISLTMLAVKEVWQKKSLRKRFARRLSLSVRFWRWWFQWTIKIVCYMSRGWSFVDSCYHLLEKSRGFGFVEFESREDCLAAQDNMDKAELFGRVLTVNVARAKAMEKNKAGMLT